MLGSIYFIKFWSEFSLNFISSIKSFKECLWVLYFFVPSAYPQWQAASVSSRSVLWFEKNPTSSNPLNGEMFMPFFSSTFILGKQLSYSFSGMHGRHDDSIFNCDELNELFDINFKTYKTFAALLVLGLCFIHISWDLSMLSRSSL